MPRRAKAPRNRLAAQARYRSHLFSQPRMMFWVISARHGFGSGWRRHVVQRVEVRGLGARHHPFCVVYLQGQTDRKP